MNNLKNIKIKICSITSAHDAKLVSDFAIDAIGLNFIERSKRKISFKTARNILKVLKRTVEAVLIFENEKINKVKKLSKLLGINTIQLHGKESPLYCNELKKSNKNLQIMKVLPAKSESLQKLSSYEKICSGFLLDSSDKKNVMGGTGKTADWNIAKKIALKSRLPVFLAGGLNPHNIKNAIKKVKPFGIDVNSGVESSIGKKDKKKIKMLFERIS